MPPRTYLRPASCLRVWAVGNGPTVSKPPPDGLLGLPCFDLVRWDSLYMLATIAEGGSRHVRHVLKSALEAPRVFWADLRRSRLHGGTSDASLTGVRHGWKRPVPPATVVAAARTLPQCWC